MTNIGFKIGFEGVKPIDIAKPVDGWLGGVIYNTKNGSAHLLVRGKGSDDPLFEKFFRINDTFTICLTDDLANTISYIDKIDNEKLHKIRHGRKQGLIIELNNGTIVRCSHPDGGGFQCMIGATSLRNIRASFMAGNDYESWSWQFPDLRVGDKMTFTFSESSEWDEAPKIKRKSDDKS
jgi:hypothetical protein